MSVWAAFGVALAVALKQSDPGYAEYTTGTSAFVPWVPKKRA